MDCPHKVAHLLALWVDIARANDMEAVIPLREGTSGYAEHDREKYKWRHLVENFCRIDFVGVDAVGHGEGALERAMAAFREMIVLLLLFLFFLLLALDRQ